MAAVYLARIRYISACGLIVVNRRRRVSRHSWPILPYEPAELYYRPVTWIRDNDGRWHATRTLSRSGIGDGTALRVEVVPPLSRTVTRIGVVTMGRSAQARARLPLDWE
jgi:hypothetical protein